MPARQDATGNLTGEGPRESTMCGTYHTVLCMGGFRDVNAACRSLERRNTLELVAFHTAHHIACGLHATVLSYHTTGCSQLRRAGSLPALDSSGLVARKCGLVVGTVLDRRRREAKKRLSSATSLQSSWCPRLRHTRPPIVGGRRVTQRPLPYCTATAIAASRNCSVIDGPP